MFSSLPQDTCLIQGPLNDAHSTSPHPSSPHTPCSSREKGTFAIVSLVYAQNCSLWPIAWESPLSPQKQLRDLQILNLILRGMKLGRIAHHLGLHRNTIAKTFRKPETQQLLESMKKDLVEQTTRDMLERHKMLDQAAEAKHTQKRIRGQGHRPQDGYAPIQRYLAHRA